LAFAAGATPPGQVSEKGTGPQGGAWARADDETMAENDTVLEDEIAKDEDEETTDEEGALVDDEITTEELDEETGQLVQALRVGAKTTVSSKLTCSSNWSGPTVHESTK
jgi:hypothetical protein